MLSPFHTPLRTLASARHLLEQGPVLAALGRTAVTALRKPNERAPSHETIEIERAPLSRTLIDDYLAHVGAKGGYRGEVPPHLFPQWCFPAFARVLLPLPYPLLRVVNGGARVEVRAPIVDHEPLVVRARLASAEDDGQRVILRQEAFTGTKTTPDALRIELTAIVPLSKKSGSSSSPKKAPVLVPDAARELRRVALGREAGLEFALLTGDVNPIHWIAPWAKLSGFRNVILHGFSTFARAWEAVVQEALDRDEHAITAFEAKLTKPLVLPHEVGFYASGQNAREIFAGDAPATPAYLTGRYETERK